MSIVLSVYLWSGRALRPVCLLIGAPMLLGFGGCNSKSLNWTEDVLLPDGRMVTVTRHQEYVRRYSWEEFGNGDYWFEFKNPQTREMVRWSHDRGLGTVALILNSTAVYLLTMVADGFGDEANDNPDPPYLLFKYDQGQWQQLTLKDMPILRLRANMTFTGYDARKRTDSAGSHLTVDVTQAAVIGTDKSWSMDFSQLREQTFGYLNRDKKRNYLLVDTQFAGDVR